MCKDARHVTITRMPQQNDWQPELFNQFQAPSRPPWWARYWRSPQRFLVLRIGYEDVVLAAIGGLMVVVLGFCLGVERGRSIAFARASSDTREAVPAVRSAPIEVPASVLAPALPIPPRISTDSPTRPAALRTKVAAASGGRTTALAGPEAGRYVVQVASFADREAAETARTRLAGKGFRASVVTKGRYYVLFAGGFATYAQATESANRLRGAYRDCFIRKLVADQRG